jgi:hypothetical protein
MNKFLHTAAQKLGFRQQSYQSVFEGSARQLVLVDLANYARAFDGDPDGMSHDALMTMHGRRQMFFRILKHLKLNPQELEYVYRPALMNAAARLQRSNPGDDE